MEQYAAIWVLSGYFRAGELDEIPALSTQKLAGEISREEIVGIPVLRIHFLHPEENVYKTCYYGLGAVVEIKPLSSKQEAEEQMRALVRW